MLEQATVSRRTASSSRQAVPINGSARKRGVATVPAARVLAVDLRTHLGQDDCIFELDEAARAIGNDRNDSRCFFRGGAIDPLRRRIEIFE